VPDHLGLVELGKRQWRGPTLVGRNPVQGVGRRVRDLVPATARAGELGKRRLERRADRPAGTQRTLVGDAIRQSACDGGPGCGSGHARGCLDGVLRLRSRPRAADL